MKKTILSIAAAFVFYTNSPAQSATQDINGMVARLDKAVTVKDFQPLAQQFQQLANSQPNNWLAWYYAGYCNAKIGWLHQNDGDEIEPFANQADEQISKALALLDTSKQKNELSEVYVVMSMVNRDRVYVNPMTQGPKYGPIASRYNQLALKVNPSNARALWLYGWEKYATPKMWGGDKKKAKELLEQALQQLNAQAGDANNPHWGKKETEELLEKLK